MNKWQTDLLSDLFARTPEGMFDAFMIRAVEADGVEFLSVSCNLSNPRPDGRPGVEFVFQDSIVSEARADGTFDQLIEAAFKAARDTATMPTAKLDKMVAKHNAAVIGPVVPGSPRPTKLS